MSEGALHEKFVAMQQMQSKRTSLMDSFDYVMFGRIFKYEDSPTGANNQASYLLIDSLTVFPCRTTCFDLLLYKGC